METRKKKLTFKRAMRNLFRNIGKYLKGLKDNFMKLSPTTRKIIYIWLVVVIVILALVFFSTKNANRLDKYKEMEKRMDDSAILYAETKQLFPNVNQKMKLDLDMLREYKYVLDTDVPDKTCKGYSLIYYDLEEEEYHVNSYLNCKHYTTKNFAEDYEQ